MRISVSLLPTMQRVDSSTEVAVVIDVLRATSVMTAALNNGAKRIITCQEIDQARQIAGNLDEAPLLCGERQCKPIEGFDHGNSPGEYETATVKNRTLILTTTNGTHAIAAASHAQSMIASSFLNREATVNHLRTAKSVHLVCAGTNGEITAEDVLLAGAIINRVQQTTAVDLASDDAILAVELWRSWMEDSGESEESLAKRFAETRGGRNLVDVGYAPDLERCAAIDSVATVPQRVSHGPDTFTLKASD